jgi:hypothetical protein
MEGAGEVKIEIAKQRVNSFRLHDFLHRHKT